MVLEKSQTLENSNEFFSFFLLIFYFSRRMNTAVHTARAHIVAFLYAYTWNTHVFTYTNTHTMRHQKSCGFSAILFDSAISVLIQILCGAFVFFRYRAAVCPFFYFEKNWYFLVRLKIITFRSDQNNSVYFSIVELNGNNSLRNSVIFGVCFHTLFSNLYVFFRPMFITCESK